MGILSPQVDSITSGMALGNRKPTIAILGDSYGVYLATGLQYACEKYYAADIEFDHRDYASGGRMFAVGGTFSNHMITNQLPQFRQRPADVVYIWSGYNSTPSSQATVLSEAANITQAADGCLAAGARMVFIMGQSWRAAGNPTYIDAVNALCFSYANRTPGVMFVAMTPLLADPTSVSTTVVPFRAGYSHDSVHPGANCMRNVIAPVIADTFKMFARKRLPRASLFSGAFNPSTAPDCDVTNSAGMMFGTSGQLNSVNNANVCGLNATNRWNVISSNAELVLTPSIITDANGFLRQRIGISGTTTAGRSIICQLQPTVAIPNGGNANYLYDMEMQVDFTGVTGIFNAYIGGGSGGTTFQDATQSIYATGNAAHLYPDGTNESLFIYSMYPFALTTANPIFQVIFSVMTGKTVAGNIDFGRLSVKRAKP